jgi:hypothetical protein
VGAEIYGLTRWFGATAHFNQHCFTDIRRHEKHRHQIRIDKPALGGSIAILRKFQAARFKHPKREGLMMKIEQDIRTIFPQEKNIPERFLLQTPIEQDVYLVNGELRHWDGPTQEVLSPVWMWESSRLVQKVIGKYPLLTEMESLNAAVNFG